MKKKYYYTCPIQALYMHIEFGVKFDTEVKISADMTNDNDFKNMTPEITKIYVKPESEHIFEPKKGDEGRWDRRVGAHYANYNGEQWVSAGIEEKLPEIIYRNGKHFFNPKEEN